MTEAPSLMAYATFQPQAVSSKKTESGAAREYRSLLNFRDEWELVKRLGDANYGKVFLFEHRAKTKGAGADVDNSEKEKEKARASKAGTEKDEAPDGQKSKSSSNSAPTETEILVIKRMANDRNAADGLMKEGLVERFCKGCDSEGENPLVEIGASKFVSFVCAERTRGHCPWILRMKGCWLDQYYTYYASEPCMRGELFSVVAERSRLTEPVAKTYMLQVLAAVQYLHKCGVAHRDISLENVLLTDDPEDRCVRLMDFGVACPIYTRNQQSGEKTAVLSSGYVGKDYYRAPEMYGDKVQYAAAPTDIFACGVCLFIMLTGKPIWKQATLPDQIFRYVRKTSVGQLIQAWKLDKVFSKDAADLIPKMLALDPAHRWNVDQCIYHAWFDAVRGGAGSGGGGADGGTASATVSGGKEADGSGSGGQGSG